MNFKQRISAHAIGILAPKDLPETASIGISEGYESGSLRTLAERYIHIHPAQLYDYYLLALNELNLSIPAPRTASVRMIRYYVFLILNGQLAPLAGFRLIDDMMKTLDFYYGDLGLHEAYEQYTAIADFSSPQFEPDDAEGLSREDAVAKGCYQLLTSLRCWLEDTQQGLLMNMVNEENLQFSH